MPGSMFFFSLLSLAPVPLLLAGSFAGGGWLWLALGYITVLSGLTDLIVGRITPPGEEAEEMRAANRLSIAVALGHFAVLGAVVHALSGASGLTWPERAVLFVAGGFYLGQVSNANAHELIHRAARGLHNLGRAVYISTLFGHAVSAHLKVHHRWAASPRDPLWPRGEEGFYRFVLRAWPGAFVAGWAAEDALRAKSEARRLHPYTVYLGGGAAVLVLVWAVEGWAGVWALLLFAAFTQSQLMLSDYVQHYGLRRAELPDGRLEPMRLGHSWNSRHWFTSFMMLNAPRHSDHHAHPARPYPALRLPGPQEAPSMPYSLPVMGVIALIPPLWRPMMRREIDGWEARRAAA